MTYAAIGDRPELLLAVLVIEALLGYPDALHRRIPHPVVWVGSLLTQMDRTWNAGSAAAQRWAGVGVVLLLIGLAVMFGVALEMVLSGWLGLALMILIATTGFAQRSLYLHVRTVLEYLEKGDLVAARQAVSKIVGRDTANLDERGVASATTESLAESFCDGIVAPAFWFLIAGLPGLFVFKAMSTADSQIGHLDDRYRYFGWAAARCAARCAASCGARWAVCSARGTSSATRWRRRWRGRRSCAAARCRPARRACWPSSTAPPRRWRRTARRRRCCTTRRVRAAPPTTVSHRCIVRV